MRSVQPVTPLARTVGYEMGARTRLLGGRVETALSLWGIDVASETVWIGDEGVTEAGGSTRRLGIEWEGRWESRRSAATDVVNASGDAKEFMKPTDYIGTKSFPDYAAYAKSHQYDIKVPGCATNGKMFVGQRKEGFAVNIGTIFDLVNADAATITNPGLRGAVPNPLDNKNVTTIALELPIACVVAAGKPAIIGTWTTASLRQARVLDPSHLLRGRLWKAAPGLRFRVCPCRL